MPRAVIFRDSSSSWLLPFLAESFSRIVAVGSQHLFYELIEREKPDVVILEIIERWMNSPHEAHGFTKKIPFEELCKLSVDEIASKTGIIVGFVDMPAPKSEMCGPFDVTGWPVSVKGVERVEVYLDGSLLGDANIGTSRPDLVVLPCADAATSGFRFELNINERNIPTGKHQLMVQAVSKDGIREKLCGISIHIVP